MRFILAFLLLVPFASLAQNVKTDSFVISLPDNLTVQTDKVRRILAFGKKRNPFINIEFGYLVGEQFSEIVDSVNETLKPMKSVLSEVDCGSGCVGFSAESVSKQGDISLYSYFYLVKSKRQNFIIAMGAPEPITDENLKAANIAKQILNSGI
ncbi:MULTISPECIES: hypothetical protein [unclassified Pseudoalteromonas]|uniref:hypothetical protein n=1 Tax=unclassified Pseudoalteromonas TaxID=194690 RepID=UPI0006D67BA1|nr:MULTISPECIES: hypothetical protein [unclassified Pseudoalteromonas]KPZ53402.1 hypothetical protein AN393_02759 [Pseudoalteromonas sp. P1-25]KPZ61543.1 hypothetical protein AN389_01620 [Pseudoalteromonas sp. P1-7a]